MIIICKIVHFEFSFIFDVCFENMLLRSSSYVSLCYFRWLECLLFFFSVVTAFPEHIYGNWRLHNNHIVMYILEYSLHNNHIVLYKIVFVHNYIHLLLCKLYSRSTISPYIEGSFFSNFYSSQQIGLRYSFRDLCIDNYMQLTYFF